MSLKTRNDINEEYTEKKHQIRVGQGNVEFEIN
jgi:hypothetical protein